MRNALTAALSRGTVPEEEENATPEKSRYLCPHRANVGVVETRRDAAGDRAMRVARRHWNRKG